MLIRLGEKLISVGLLFNIFWFGLFGQVLWYEYKYFVFFSLLILTILFRGGYKSLISEKENFLLWIFLLSIACGMFFAQKTQLAFQKGYEFIPLIVCYFFVFKLNFKQENCLMVLKIFVVCAIIMSVVGFLEFVFHTNLFYEYLMDQPFYKDWIGRRVMSLMVHPSVFGSYLAFFMPLFYCLLSLSNNRISKFFWLACLILISIVLILTFSRSSFIASVIATSVYLVNKRRKKLLVIFLLCIIFLVIFCTFAGKSSSFYRLGVFRILESRRMFYYYSRFITTMRIVRDYPIFGIGIDNFRYFFYRYYPFDPRLVHPLTNIPDNMYLMILGETGLFGFLSFMFLIFHILKRGFLCLRKLAMKNKMNAEIMLAFLCSIIVLLVNMLTYEIFYWPTPFFLFWMMLGMVSGMTKHFLKND